MLGTISSESFTPLVNKNCWIEAPNGELELTVSKVSEHPLAALPNAPRVPFSVLFKGPLSPYLQDGMYSMRVEGEEAWRLEGVSLNRIQPPGGERDVAFYQMVFN